MSLTGHIYKRRPIRFLGLWENRRWRIKIYGISSLGETPEPQLVERAKVVAALALPDPSVDDSRYGVGFLVIHQAEMFNQIVVDWWERVNELRHHVYKAPPESPEEFEEITGSGEAFCIWELRVIGFERDAWVKEVLKHRNRKGIEGYLNCRLSEDA